VVAIIFDWPHGCSIMSLSLGFQCPAEYDICLGDGADLITSLSGMTSPRHGMPHVDTRRMTCGPHPPKGQIRLRITTVRAADALLQYGLHATYGVGYDEYWVPVINPIVCRYLGTCQSQRPFMANSSTGGDECSSSCAPAANREARSLESTHPSCIPTSRFFAGHYCQPTTTHHHHHHHPNRTTHSASVDHRDTFLNPLRRILCITFFSLCSYPHFLHRGFG
jgi:hypothetical protein